MSKNPESQTMEDILKTYLDNIQRGVEMAHLKWRYVSEQPEV